MNSFHLVKVNREIQYIKHYLYDNDLKCVYLFSIKCTVYLIFIEILLVLL
nr:hypothetical protein B11C_140002 [Bartonella sp. 1-1C]